MSAGGTVVTEAIVCRLVDYGESDRIATLLTRDAGKVGALARGARKSHRRFGGLGLFTVGEVTLHRRRGDLWGCDGFVPRLGFAAIASDMGRVAHAAYATELARELVPLEAHDERIFELVCAMLTDIDARGVLPAELRVYELALLDAVGLAPSLDRCVACDGEPGDDERQRLDARRGGVLCGRCGAGAAGGSPSLALGGAARRALLDAQQGRALEVPAAVAAVTRAALQALIGEHLGRPLRSLEFIAKLNASARRDLDKSPA